MLLTAESGQTDHVIGFPALLRRESRLPRVVGLSFNYVPVRLSIDRDASVQDCVLAAAQALSTTKARLDGIVAISNGVTNALPPSPLNVASGDNTMADELAERGSASACVARCKAAFSSPSAASKFCRVALSPRNSCVVET